MKSVRTVDYTKDIELALDRAKWLDMGVAFATASGFDFGSIQQKLKQMVQTGRNVRIIVDLRLGNTDPEFLETITQWGQKKRNLKCRAYLSGGEGVFHPKLFLFGLDNDKALVISGSANFTGPAFSRNIEHGIIMEGTLIEPPIAEAKRQFDNWWNSQEAKPIDAEVIAHYRNFWRQRRGLESKAQRRTGALWQNVRNCLEATATPGFEWPSADAAFLLGVLTARGSIDRRRRKMGIAFRYGGQNYQHNDKRGYIGKGTVSYKASRVVPLVPQFVKSRIARVISPGTIGLRQIGKWTFNLEINCKRNPKLLSELRRFFNSASNYKEFPIPHQMSTASRSVREEFARGYALACGLVSSGTYDPTGKHQVWFRPATENPTQFDRMAEFLQSLGLVTYTHRRATRDVEIKVMCEAWLDIGFGIEWLDHLVQEGARLNEEPT